MLEKIWAELIVAGRRSLDQCPLFFKAGVVSLLLEWGWLPPDDNEIK